jgi:hypothetical protein
MKAETVILNKNVFNLGSLFIQQRIGLNLLDIFFELQLLLITDYIYFFNHKRVEV